MVKTIIFDFWGTLVENGVWSPTKQVRNILNIKVPFSEYVIRMEKAMMTRPFDTLKEAFESVCKEFAIEPSNEQMDELIGLWNKSWMLAKPYPETGVVLERLKSRYKLILVSNTDSISIPKVLEKFDIGKYFEKTFLSFEMNMIKTDNDFLRIVLNEIGQDVKDCVLIGDSLESDMAAAKKIGLKAILVDRRGTRDFDPKINNLKDLNNKLL